LGPAPDSLYDPLRAMEPEPAEALPEESILYWLKGERRPSAEAADQEESTEVLPEYSSPAGAAWTDTGPIVQEVAVATGSPYAEWVRQAHEAMRQEDYREADRLYNEALALDPGRPVALFGRIHALVGLGHYNQAALVLARYLAKHPDWAEAPPDIASAYSDPGVYDRVVEELQRTVEARPESATHTFMLGYVLYAGGRRAEARPYLESAAAAEEKRQAAQALLDAFAAAPR
jgi:tetratricopeptide (TPR) repeat protein